MAILRFLNPAVATKKKLSFEYFMSKI